MSKDIATVSRTREIIKKYDFHFKKAYGQNFLVDVNILQKIVDNADITSQTMVIEIGPGIGSLTEQLAKKAKKVIAYEIDRSLMPILEDTLSDYDNIKILNEDILKANVLKMIEHEFIDCSDIAVVANLPYYITTPILMNLIQQRLPINRYCVMMQKEVAKRLCGGPSTKEYNALTIAVQYYTVPKIVMNVPRTVFIPEPNVDSAVLKLDVREKPVVEVKDESIFFKVVRGSFIQRRKTIYNNLKQSLKEIKPEKIMEALERVNISPSIRGEALTIEQFALLSDELLKIISL
ncbi:16S rRNA (adenine(1518)-N(6)/adenine(1519)-N(6))-dimethyltransferase RsmA [Mycoplasmatota bacterium]|nr:16S rRNA (adenine(1518)-N(6)/adenine(1519)-N(6))-dimethyltransferase RsmA [Mycoplasmatota bacterium]